MACSDVFADKSGFSYLCSKSEKIIELMDTVKEFDVVYDDTKDNNSISYDEVRKDVAKPSFPTEKLLSNTQPSGNCYVVPKMVD